MVYLAEQVIRQLYEAFNQRNFEVVVKLYADDVRLVCPGRNQVAGEYRGRQGVLDFWNKQVQLSDGTYQGNLIAVAESDEHIVLITEVNIQRAGKAYTWRRILHYVMYDARVKECHVYEGDPYMADEAFR